MECIREQIAYIIYTPATLSFKSGRGFQIIRASRLGLTDRREERGCLKAGLCSKLCVPHWNDLVSLFLRHLVQCLTHTEHNNWHRKS